jgi:hypothetical protein
LKTWEQKLSGQQIKLDTQAQNLTTEMEELRNERTRLRRIPIALVAEKLGFVLDEWGDLSAELPDKSGFLFTQRLVLNGECFDVECERYRGAGNYVWEHESKGKGAIDLMQAFMPKRPVLEACARLAELFPESKAGIILELSESSNPDLWKELAPQNPVIAPSTNLDANREPNSKNEPDMT